MSVHNYSDSLLAQIRDKFNELLIQDGGSYDPSLLQTITETYTITSILFDHFWEQDVRKTVDKTAHALLHSLRWRQERKVHELRALIPREFFDLRHSFFFDYGDRLVYYSRPSCLPRATRTFAKELENYIVWYLDAIHTIRNGRRMDIVVDCAGCSWSHFQDGLSIFKLTR